MTKATMSGVVRHVANQHPEIADPKELAQLVLDEIRGLEADLLARIMPGIVSGVLRRRRATTSDEDTWAQFLNERVPTADGTVFARDATAEELEAGAERRRSFAGNLDQRAIQYQRVADEMRVAGVDRAGDLRAGYLLIEHLRGELERELTARRDLDCAVKNLRGWITALERFRELEIGKASPSLIVLRKRKEQLMQAKALLEEGLADQDKRDAAIRKITGTDRG